LWTFIAYCQIFYALKYPKILFDKFSKSEYLLHFFILGRKSFFEHKLAFASFCSLLSMQKWWNFSQISLGPLTKLITKVEKIFWTQPFWAWPNFVPFHLVNELNLCCAQISLLPSSVIQHSCYPADSSSFLGSELFGC